MNNRDVITFQSRMSSGAERVMSIEADEAASVAAELLQQVETAEKREEDDNAKVAAKLGRGATAKTTSSSRKQKHPVGSKEHGVQRVEKAMEVLSARNQRHKKRVRIQVLVSDLNRTSTLSGRKARGGWQLAGQEEEKDKNFVAKAMLHGWCCGFDVEHQDKMKARGPR